LHEIARSSFPAGSDQNNALKRLPLLACAQS